MNLKQYKFQLTKKTSIKTQKILNHNFKFVRVFRLTMLMVRAIDQIFVLFVKYSIMQECDRAVTFYMRRHFNMLFRYWIMFSLELAYTIFLYILRAKYVNTFFYINFILKMQWRQYNLIICHRCTHSQKR